MCLAAVLALKFLTYIYGDGYKERRYEEAMDVMEQGNYEEAELLFAELDEYGNADWHGRHCRFQRALALYEDRKYAEALPLLWEMGSCESARHYAVVCALRLDQNAWIEETVERMNKELFLKNYLV